MATDSETYASNVKRENNGHLLRNATKYGSTRRALDLLDLGPGEINVHYNHDEIITLAIEGNQIEIAQRIIELEPVHGKIRDIHRNKDYYFRTCCEKGYLPMAKWLLSLESTHSKFDIHAEDNAGIRWACLNDHAHLTKWLLSLEETHGKFNLTYGQKLRQFGSFKNSNGEDLDITGGTHTSIALALTLPDLDPEHHLVDHTGAIPIAVSFLETRHYTDARAIHKKIGKWLNTIYEKKAQEILVQLAQKAMASKATTNTPTQ